MRMRSPIALPTPRREPSYRNALPSRLACNQLNPLQFESLLGDLQAQAPSKPWRGVTKVLQGVLGRFVPLVVQKFPRTGQ